MPCAHLPLLAQRSTIYGNAKTSLEEDDARVWRILYVDGGGSLLLFNKMIDKKGESAITSDQSTMAPFHKNWRNLIIIKLISNPLFVAFDLRLSFFLFLLLREKTYHQNEYLANHLLIDAMLTFNTYYLLLGYWKNSSSLTTFLPLLKTSSINHQLW